MIVRRCCWNNCGADGTSIYEGRFAYFCSQDMCNGDIADINLIEGEGSGEELQTTTTTTRITITTTIRITTTTTTRSLSSTMTTSMYLYKMNN
jgi:plastocyanin domain-containing protein